MSFGRIRRGPMAADQFTQIRNALFRDARLSAKAKGIFGFISTHQDGWGVTPESIAASMTDGVSAIRTGLRELEALGYLVRDQPRHPDGTMGPIEYYITDRPSSEPVVENHPAGATSKNAENRRSEPIDGNPHADDPHADDRPHKKTIPLGKKIIGEKTTSSSLAEVSPELFAVVAGAESGGGGGSLDESRSTAIYIAGALDYWGKPPDKRQRQVIEDRLTAALASGWSVDGLALYLELGEGPVQSPAAVYAYRLHPDNIPAPESPPAPQVPRGGIRDSLPTAEEYASLTMEDVLGAGRPDPVPAGAWGEATARARIRVGGGGTGDRVAGWAAVGRQLAGRRPYSNDARSAEAIEADAANIPHCGDLDCDPVSRMRDHDVGNGLKTCSQCTKCHPSMQF